ncbi:MAG: EAL domain-containing protein [Leptolyngbya sp.]|nr:EAL domain-containing protein [Leptolyngbya sp.]
MSDFVVPHPDSVGIPHGVKVQQRLAYQHLIDNLPGIVFQSVKDATWSMRYLSAGCEPLTGYSAEDLLGGKEGLTYNHITHPEDLPRVLETIHSRLSTHHTYEVEYRLQPRQGGEKWVWEKGIAILDDQGQVVGLEGFITDITPLKQSEAALRTIEKTLRSRESFLQLVLDSIPQPVFWKDCQSRFLGCNRAFAAAMGLPNPQAMVGLTDADLAAIQAEDVAYYQARDRLVMDYNQPDLHSLEPQRYADGQRRWVDCSRLPMHNDQGEVIGLLAIFDDITDQILAHQALKIREAYLSTISALQHQLLSWRWDWTDPNLMQIFATLGDLSGASRVYYYELFPDETHQLMLRQRFEWSASDIPSTFHIPAFQVMPVIPLFEDWYHLLAQGQCINLTQDRFSEMQYQALALPPSNVKSLLLLPLTIRGQLQGVMGFSHCVTSQVWGQAEVDLLQVVTADIALALERQQAEEALRRAEAKYRSMFENAVEGIFQSMPSGQYLVANPMLAKIYGYDSVADLIAQVTDINHQIYVDPHRRQAFTEAMATTGSVIGFESEVYRKDGQIIWISESARAIYDDQGQIVSYEGTVEDITERKIAEAELLRRDQLLQGVAQASHRLLAATQLDIVIPEVLAILGEAANTDRAYLYENHPQSETGEVAMSMRYEWTRPEIAPTITQSHWQDQSYATLGVERWYEIFLKNQPVRGLVRHFPPHEQELLGRDDILSILMVPIFVDQALWGYIGFDACREEWVWSTSDESILVTVAASLGGRLKRQETEKKMYHQAYHDTLTGLPNRTFFNQYLPEALDHARHHNQMLAVVFLDLDRFKTINDTLSHAVGDLLLQQVTQRIARSLRAGDIVSRWGGDEFTLILPNLSSPEDCAKVAQRIAHQLTEPFMINGHELYVTTSIGIALYPQDGHEMSVLMQNADAAMYRAKEQGRNTYQFYTQALSAEVSQRLQLESFLHHALARQELQLHYQPQVDLDMGSVVQMEALLRWHHPKLGLVSPPAFIPLAEETGLIISIGEWVLRTACAQVVAWQRQMGCPIRIAVNLSARQLQHPDLVSCVAAVLQDTGLAAQDLELEITETVAMADVETSIRRLLALRQLGIRISMDDFGTGYSCLSYLKQIPLNSLKIDRAFVRDLPANAADQAMVQAITAMAQGLGLSIVAEGVETLEQVNYLRRYHCFAMQGYLLGKPLPAKDATHYLTHRYDYLQSKGSQASLPSAS